MQTRSARPSARPSVRPLTPFASPSPPRLPRLGTVVSAFQTGRRFTVGVSVHRGQHACHVTRRPCYRYIQRNSLLTSAPATEVAPAGNDVAIVCIWDSEASVQPGIMQLNAGEHGQPRQISFVLSCTLDSALPQSSGNPCCT